MRKKALGKAKMRGDSLLMTLFLGQMIMKHILRNFVS